MAKIAYHDTWGSFSLSRKAWQHYAELKGLRLSENRRGFVEGVIDKNGKIIDEEEIPRHDPDLIKALEDAGDIGNGIEIREVPDGTLYRITDYGDGLEGVLTYEEHYWRIAL